jgi:hypothetical protein
MIARYFTAEKWHDFESIIQTYNTIIVFLCQLHVKIDTIFIDEGNST